MSSTNSSQPSDSPTLVKQMYEGLEAKLKRDAANTKPRTPDRFWASELGRCTREVYYRHKGVKPIPMKPKLQMLLWSGTAIHDFFRLKMASTLLGVEIRGDVREERFTYEDDKVTITGYMDGLSIAQRYVEIKTMGDFPFKKLLKAEETGGDRVRYLRKRNLAYWLQCQLIAGHLNLPEIEFVPLNRDSGELGFAGDALVIPTDKKALQVAIERAHHIQSFKEKDEPPPYEEPYSKSYWKCKTCAFRKECYK